MSQLRYAAAAAVLMAAGVVAGSAGLAGTAYAADSAEWNVTSFHATLHAQNDGRLQVHEQIVFDFGTSPGHGIIQYVNHQALHPDGPQVAVSDVKVASPDGAPANTALTDTGTSTKITVGDPATTITGRHTYDVDYTVTGALYADADHPNTAGLLWEVVDDWDVPISDIEVTVTMPGKVDTDHCWAGEIGTTATCDADTKNDATITVKQAHLDADQQLTEQASSALGAATLPTSSAAQYPLSAPSSSSSYGDSLGSSDEYLADPSSSPSSSSHAGVFVLLAMLLGVVGAITFIAKRAGGGGGGGGGNGRSYNGSRDRSRGYESWRETSFYDSGSSWSDSSSSGGFSGGDSGGGSSGDSGQSGGW